MLYKMLQSDINYNLSIIQKNAEVIDGEDIHLKLLKKVENGEYESLLEAFSAWVEENDFDLDEKVIKKYISPSLYGILYREALNRSLLKDKHNHIAIEDFF